MSLQGKICTACGVGSYYYSLGRDGWVCGECHSFEPLNAQLDGGTDAQMRDLGELSTVARDDVIKFWARALVKAVTVVFPLTGKDLDAAAGFVPLSKPQPGEQPKSVFPRQAMRNDWGGLR